MAEHFPGVNQAMAQMEMERAPEQLCVSGHSYICMLRDYVDA